MKPPVKRKVFPLTRATELEGSACTPESQFMIGTGNFFKERMTVIAGRGRPKGSTTVNKNQKPQKIKPVEHVERSYYCECCGKEYSKQKGNFYKSMSPLFRGNDGYINTCKKCIDNLFSQFTNFYNDVEESAIERLCQIFDWYFDEEVCSQARKVNADNSRIGSYISKLNLAQTVQKGTTYSDTIINKVKTAITDKDTLDEFNEGADEKIPKKTIKFFGYGFEPYDYQTLQVQYDDWIKKYGAPEEKAKEELYKNLCFIQLQIQKGVQRGDNISQLINAFNTLLGTANLKPSDGKQNSDNPNEVYGVWLRDIEKYTPADYYADKKIYYDSDKIRDYVERFIFRPLKNLFTGSKDFDKEFNISVTEDE